jgi:hypothetical protein
MMAFGLAWPPPSRLLLGGKAKKNDIVAGG